MNEVVSELTKRGYLVSDDFISNLPSDFDVEVFLSLINEKIGKNEEILVLNKDLLFAVLNNKNSVELNWKEFDQSKALLEKGKDGELYGTFKEVLNYEKNKEKVDEIIHSVNKEDKVVIEDNEINESSVLVLKSYKEDAKKRSVEDFVSYFRKRYEGISNILKSRQELRDVISLNRLKGKQDNEKAAIIGIVVERRITKNDNVMLKVEDFTGDVFVLINKNKMDIYNEAKDICEDEIIGVIGSKSGGFVFVDELILPDVPVSKGVKKYDEDVYCAFISDLHVGSKEFLAEAFDKFLKWLNKESGTEEQKMIAGKLKYLFIAGDLVDGVGIYPGQEEDSNITDIFLQYEELTKFIKKIPSHIQIIISPGNHDALRLTEPQPAIGENYCEELTKMENVYMVSNPSFVNIHANENFEGFDVLLYHGSSFNYYIDNVESIRLNGGYKRADLVMQYLMKHRHLAPTHTSTSYIPTVEADNLIIDKVPDFFVTGHIHRLSVSSYRCVSLINASCWIGQTDFQEKVGLVPEPGKVVVANLATRDMKIINFCEDGSE
jgi:DNA polymerase II small subunit